MLLLLIMYCSKMRAERAEGRPARRLHACIGLQIMKPRRGLDYLREQREAETRLRAVRRQHRIGRWTTNPAVSEATNAGAPEWRHGRRHGWCLVGRDACGCGQRWPAYHSIEACQAEARKHVRGAG